jgi:hypothetical protein
MIAVLKINYIIHIKRLKRPKNLPYTHNPHTLLLIKKKERRLQSHVPLIAFLNQIPILIFHAVPCHVFESHDVPDSQ